MNKECAASLIFLFVGIYGLIFSIQLPLGNWREPGPAMFPLGLSILLCLSGVLWFIYGKRKGEERIDWGGLVRKLVTPLKIVGLTAVFILTLDRLGYLVTASLYMFFLFLWVSRYKLGTTVGLAIALGVGSWFFFEKLLAVQLPKGLLPL
jgi:putative tricarboxylic transport membrane protein